MYLLRHSCKGRRHALHQLGIACLNAMCQVVPEARCKHSIELSAALLQPLELPKQCERGGDSSRSCSSISDCSCRHSHVRSRVARDSCHAECVCSVRARSARLLCAGGCSVHVLIVECADLLLHKLDVLVSH